MNNKININAIEWQEAGEKNFNSYRKQLGRKAGGKMLGTSLYKLLPSKKAFPFHCHLANEEAIFVLSGSGTLRLGDKNISIEEGDYIALPRGRSHSHQVINTSDAELIYLCISTMIEPDVMEYPDSDKIGIMTDTPPGGEKKSGSYKGFYHKKSAVSYYDNEE